MSEGVTDPVLEVLLQLKETAPTTLLPLIEAYKSHGIEGFDDAWKTIVKAATDENQ